MKPRNVEMAHGIMDGGAARSKQELQEIRDAQVENIIIKSFIMTNLSGWSVLLHIKPRQRRRWSLLLQVPKQNHMYDH